MLIFRKKRFIGYIVLLIVSAYFYFQPGYYFGEIVKDYDHNFERLSNAFKPQVTQKYLGPFNSHSYQHKDGNWEIIQSAPLVPWYANFIDTNGKHSDKFLEFQNIWTDVDRMYFKKPYLFLTSYPGYLHIYNTETHQLKTFDARSSGCHDNFTYLAGVAYDGGVLYTSQYKDWSRCRGNFKRKFSLDF